MRLLARLSETNAVESSTIQRNEYYVDQDAASVDRMGSTR